MAERQKKILQDLHRSVATKQNNGTFIVQELN